MKQILNSPFITKKRIIIAAAALVFGIALIVRVWVAGWDKTVPPKIGPIVEVVYALGTVKSEHTYNLRLGIPASIISIFVTEGQEVKRGAPLLVTDSGVAFDAPFSGIVYKLNFEKGENVMPGTPVLTIIDPSTIYILVSLDQQSAMRVKKSQPVELSFEGIRNTKSTGMVDRIYPSNGQFYARIYSRTIPAGVLPDMNVDCAIAVGKKDKALLIPAAALKEGAVTLYRNKKKMMVRCQTGAVNEGWTEVTDNSILPNDEIVVDKIPGQ